MAAGGLLSADKTKQRLVGSIVLFVLLVIIVLMLPDKDVREVEVVEAVVIPPKPADLNVKVVPMTPPRIAVAPDVAEPPAPAAVASPEESTPVAPAPEPAPTQQTSPAQAEAPAPPAAAPAQAVIANPVGDGKVPLSPPQWVIQAGSFTARENAEALSQRLIAEKYQAFVREVVTDKGSSFRVHVGPEADRSRLEPLREKLEKLLGSRVIIIAHEP